LCEDPLDEAVEAEAAEVVGHLIGGVVRAEQTGDEAPKPRTTERHLAIVSGALNQLR